MAAIAAFLLLPAAPSMAAWTNPLFVNSVNGDASSPQVGLAADGTAVVTYREASGAIFVATRTSDGTVTPRVPVSPVPSGPPFAATNAAGATVIAWQQSNGVNSRLHMRVRQPVQNVTPTGMNVVEFDLGVSGDTSRAMFAFSEFENGLQVLRARERRPDGTYGPTDLVSSANGLAALNPRLAVNPAGQAAATWRQQQDDERGDLIWVGTNFL
jgi:hypothetical protein